MTPKIRASTSSVTRLHVITALMPYIQQTGLEDAGYFSTGASSPWRPVECELHALAGSRICVYAGFSRCWFKRWTDSGSSWGHKSTVQHSAGVLPPPAFVYICLSPSRLLWCQINVLALLLSTSAEWLVYNISSMNANRGQAITTALNCRLWFHKL